MIDDRFLPDDHGFIMFIPGFYADNQDVVCLYDLASIVELLHNDDRGLVGHPSKDLPDWAWFNIKYPASKVARWLKRDRILKVRLRDNTLKSFIPGTPAPLAATTVRYCEPGEWRALLTEKEVAWLEQCCHMSYLYKKEVEPEPEPVKPKRRRLTRKQRRRMERDANAVL
jgi:hypothetical protein